MSLSFSLYLTGRNPFYMRLLASCHTVARLLIGGYRSTVELSKRKTKRHKYGESSCDLNPGSRWMRGSRESRYLATASRRMFTCPTSSIEPVVDSDQSNSKRPSRRAVVRLGSAGKDAVRQRESRSLQGTWNVLLAAYYSHMLTCLLGRLYGIRKA